MSHGSYQMRWDLGAQDLEEYPESTRFDMWYISIAHDFEYFRASKYIQMWKTIELIHSVIGSIESVK
jgi:hypothetical protein